MLVAKQKKKRNANGQVGMHRMWTPQDWRNVDKILTNIKKQNLVLWSVYQLLGNDSANKFPRELMRAPIGHPLLDNGSVNVPP
jgi:hypothetical protein